MPFPQRLLNDHEELVIDQNPNPWFFFGPSLSTGVALIVLLVAWLDDWEDWLQTGLAIVVLVGLLWTLGRAVRWRSTVFVVTTDRVIFRSGVFSKRGVEIPLDRVNTVFFHQRVLERLVGAGDLTIESGGERGSETFTDISHPSEVQNEIYKQIEGNRRRNFGTRVDAAATASNELSIPDQIAQLDRLRQAGSLSDEEFQAKKAELLDRM